MQNKFISKLKFVWNSIKSTFEKFKKNCGYFFHSIKLMFAARKVRADKNAKQKEQQKQFAEKLAAENEKASSKKRDEEKSKKEKEAFEHGDIKFPDKDEQTEPGIYITPAKVRRAILHFFDFVASMIFVSMIVLVLKPSLIYENWELAPEVMDTFIYKLADLITQSFLNINLNCTCGFEDCIPLLNLVVMIALASYVLIKVSVIFLCKDSSKVVSLLLVLLIVMLLFVFERISIPLILFTIVLYFTFQIACFLPTKTILKKFDRIIFCTLAGYLIAHIFLSRDFLIAIVNLFSTLRLTNV